MHYYNTIEPATTSPVISTQRVKSLCVKDIPAILELENACWLPGLRANEVILRKRFEMGHLSLGILINEDLVGMTSFSYSHFSPGDTGGLPVTFSGLSSRLMGDNYNTAFAYNLNIHPRVRGGMMIRELLTAGLNRMREDGCRYLLGAGRCPSYNGSMWAGIEAIQPSPEFRKTIDDSMLTGTLPVTGDLIVDPVLRFYQRTLDCIFLKIVPDFLPGDVPSGGFGVIFYKAL